MQSRAWFRPARAGWVLVALAGCAFEPTGDRPFDPPPEFREWFARTEACSGRTGDFDRIRWYVVDGESFPCPGGRCVGRWNDNHHIYLASAYAGSELVVRHEMLHDLLNRGGHPDPPFGNPCPLTWETWPGGAAPAAASGRAIGLPRPRID